MDRRINIGEFFCMKQRSGFQRWGKMKIILPKLFDARAPCFEFGFEAVGVEKLIHQQGFLNTFPPSQLSAWFIKAKKWLYMMMSFLSDCQLKPGSSVVRGKSFFAGRALLILFLKKNALDIPGGDFPLVGSYCFIKNLWSLRAFLNILVGNAGLLWGIWLVISQCFQSDSSVVTPTQSMPGVVLGSHVPYMSIATCRRSSRGKPKDLCKWWSQAEGQGWHFVAMGKRQLFLLARDESPSVPSPRDSRGSHGWHPDFLILW